MKKLILFMCWGIPVFAQVGIGTIAPTETLDINGTLKIRTINEAVQPEAFKETILVAENSVLKKITTRDVVSTALPSVVKGTCAFSSTISLSLLSGSSVIPFDTEEFDINEEFDILTHSYSAKQDGIYEVFIQVEMEATIGAATNLGVSVLKNGTVIQRNSFANVSLLGTNYTSPVRQLKTVVALEIGDTIHFELEGDIALGSIDLAGNSTSNYFSILQLR